MARQGNDVTDAAQAQRGLQTVRAERGLTGLFVGAPEIPGETAMELGRVLVSRIN